MTTPRLVRLITNRLIILSIAAFLLLNTPLHNLYSFSGGETGDSAGPEGSKPAPSLFSDINQNQWFYGSINEACDLGLLEKTGDKFRPYEPVTAAEMLKILVAAAGYKEAVSSPWYGNYVLRAQELGFISSNEISEYEKPVTKLEAASMTGRFLNLDFNSLKPSDNVFSDTFNPYPKLLYREAILMPYAFNGKIAFRPGEAISRAEAVSLVLKAFKYKKDPAGFKSSELLKKKSGMVLPILMYHDISPDPAQWSSLVASPDKLAADMAALKDNGFTAVNFSDLLAYADGYADLPGKPVVITFDDGYKGVYEYAFPIFKNLNMKFVASPVGITIGDPDYNIKYTTRHLSAENISEMFQTGLAEFQNHSYDMHRTAQGSNSSGVLENTDESNGDYQRRLFLDAEKCNALLQSITGLTPKVFVYPMGYHSETSEKILKDMGFRATLTTVNGINTIDDGLFLMKRIAVSNSLSTEDLLNKIGVEVQPAEQPVEPAG